MNLVGPGPWAQAGSLTVHHVLNPCSSSLTDLLARCYLSDLLTKLHSWHPWRRWSPRPWSPWRPRMWRRTQGLAMLSVRRPEPRGRWAQRLVKGLGKVFLWTSLGLLARSSSLASMANTRSGTWALLATGGWNPLHHGTSSLTVKSRLLD